MGNYATIIDALRKTHSSPTCELDFGTPFELLVSVILSAQCTDKRVNAITPALFSKYNTPEAVAAMSEEQLIPYIRSCGFYNNKAKNIIQAAKDILARFDGKVPDTVQALTSLAGVGRKTANVVYSVAFGGAAIAVDTHVFRVSRRLGIASAATPDGVERELMVFFPQALWSEAHHLLIHHGRYVCKAAKPRCGECLLYKECEYYSRLEK